MKNILLVGEWKSPNLGDLVLCNCCYKYIEKELPESNLIKFDLSFGFSPNKFQHWLYSKLGILISTYNQIIGNKEYNPVLLQSYLRSKIYIKKVLKELPKIDCIIFCGGQIFLDYFTYCVSEIVFYAELKGIPIIWNACGGSVLTSTSREIFNRCINGPMTQSISVRDNINDFKSINPKAKLVPDTAILASEYYSYEIGYENMIGLGVISYDLIKERLNGKITKTEIICFWKNLISKIEKLGLKWKFFTNGDPEDYNTAKQLLEQFGYCNSDIHLIDSPVSDNELVNVISKFEAIVSFRLHSHIIAYSLGIPSYGLAWDKKVVDFFTLSNRAEYCSDLGDFNPDKAFNFISDRRMCAHENALAERVKEHMYNDIINKL